MIKSLFKISLIMTLLVSVFVSCKSEKEQTSSHPFAAYFYQYDSIPKIYAYRDVSGGLEEQFKRVYGVEDSKGKHIIIETYVETGRLRDALNFDADSLLLRDHMVVDGKGQKISAQVLKNGYFPQSEKNEVWFASRFPGFYDSTLILQEHKSKIYSKASKMKVLDENKNVIKTKEHIRWTLFNPILKTENVMEVDQISYYAEGIGLVEYHDPNKKAHYKLEKIYSQKEWIELLTY